MANSVQVRQRVCAVLGCRRRSDLIRVKTMTLGGEGALLLDVEMCPEHEAAHSAALHMVFTETFGVDFVDPERN